MRYLEDFRAGEVIELGSCTISEEEILDFARRYDPQLFHVDPERAQASIYGGLIASGWQTCGLFMRLAVDGVIGDSSSMGSPGLDNLRWLLPVRPGDTLRGALHRAGGHAVAQPPRPGYPEVPGRDDQSARRDGAVIGGRGVLRAATGIESNCTRRPPPSP